LKCYETLQILFMYFYRRLCKQTIQNSIFRLCLGVSWESSFLKLCFYVYLIRFKIFLNCIIPCLGLLWSFNDFLYDLNLPLKFLNLFIWVICIWLWLSWFVSVFFELYQTSFRFHNMIEILAYADLNRFNLHLKIGLFDSLFLSFIWIFISFRSSHFTLFELYHAFYYLIQARCFVAKLTIFTHHYIYTYSHTFLFIESICK